jgi:AraC-like DNA-binding protein
MKEFLKPEYLDIALRPEKWQVISSLIPIELNPTEDDNYQAWANHNCDNHPHREILFCLEGGGFYSYQGQLYPCKSGSLFLIGSDEFHACGYPESSAKQIHLWLYIIKKQLVGRFFNISSNNGVISSSNFVFSKPEEAIVLENIWNELEKDSELSADLKRRKFTFALANMLVYVMENIKKDSTATDSAKYRQKIILTVKDYINETMASGKTVGDLARIAGYSKYHFMRIFKEETNMTIHEYINTKRRKKVAEMLKDGISKKEIGYELGFSSPVAFANWLKKNG